MFIDTLQPVEECLPVRQRSRPPQLPANRTVLVMEGNAALLVTIASILRLAGFHILPAQTPARAISICRRPEVTIDLILLDFSLPGENETELVEELTTLRPDLPMIFMSGNPAAFQNIWESALSS